MSAVCHALPLLALVFCTWTVALGGLASLQAACETSLLNMVGTVGLSPVVLTCKEVYRFHWFIIAFEFVVIGMACMAAVAGCLTKARPAWVGLFAVLAILYIFMTDTFLTLESSPAFQSGALLHRIRTMVAGSLMTALMNVALMMAFGMECKDGKCPVICHGDASHKAKAAPKEEAPVPMGEDQA